MTLERKTYTVAEAADLLRVSPWSIRDYIRRGDLPASRIIGRRRLIIARDDLQRFIGPARDEQGKPTGDKSSWMCPR